MRNAEIAQEGSPRDLYEAPADNFVADFIGDANLVTAEIESLDNGEALVRIGAVSRRLPARGLDLGAVQVAIRPEAIRIARNGAAGAFERSEEHTSELQSLMRISYAVFCLKKKTQNSRR